MNQTYVKQLQAIVAICIFATSSLCAVDAPTENKEQEVTIEWQTEGSLQDAQKVFIQAFAHAYKDIPLETLKVQNLHAFLESAFEDEEKDMKEMPGFHCAVAKQSTEVVGYISVEPGEQEGEVYIRQCAVNPSLWGHNIGTALVHAIPEKLPDTKKMLVIFRKVNTGASAFYHKLGFKDSEYMHAKYSPERYTGCEKNLTN